jgi:hypothetical protein
MDKNNHSKKALVGNKYTERFTDRQSMSKDKYIHFIPSVNIIYHWQNIIYNSVSMLTVAVIFAVIVFQLFGIYR